MAKRHAKITQTLSPDSHEPSQAVEMRTRKITGIIMRMTDSLKLENVLLTVKHPEGTMTTILLAPTVTEVEKLLNDAKRTAAEYRKYAGKSTK